MLKRAREKQEENYYQVGNGFWSEATDDLRKWHRARLVWKEGMKGNVHHSWPQEIGQNGWNRNAGDVAGKADHS